MYCPNCGKKYEQKVNFCCHCGTAMANPASAPKNPLTRSRKGKKIAGVCGGFAEYADLDPTLVRIVWLVAAIFSGVGFVAYLVAWIVMPEEPEIVKSSETVSATPEQPSPSQ